MKHNNEFVRLLEALILPRFDRNLVRVEHVPLKKSIQLSVRYNGKDEDYIERSVLVSQATLGNIYHITLKETAPDVEHEIYSHVIHTTDIEKNVFEDPYCYLIEKAIDYIRNFLMCPARFDRTPPVALYLKAKEINLNWIDVKDYRVVPHLAIGDLGDRWCFNIVHMSDTVVCSHIDPQSFSGITCRAIIEATKHAFQRGREEGAMCAIEKSMAITIASITDISTVTPSNLPQELRLAWTGASLRKKRHQV